MTREKIDRSEQRETQIRVIHSKTLKLVLNSIVIDVVVVHYDITNMFTYTHILFLC